MVWMTDRLCLQCSEGRYDGYVSEALTTPCALCGHQAPAEMTTEAYAAASRQRGEVIEQAIEAAKQQCPHLLFLAHAIRPDVREEIIAFLATCQSRTHRSPYGLILFEDEREALLCKLRFGR